MITAEQRKRRQQHLGSSDAPIALGLSPFMTPTELYYEKVAEELPEDKPTDAMQLGNLLEGPLVAMAAERMGAKIITDPKKLEFLHADGIRSANLDSIIVGQKQAIESKYVGPSQLSEWGESGTDQVPPGVLMQCMHQMAVTGFEKVHVVALLSFYVPKVQIYEVPRDNEMIDLLTEQELEWWNEHIVKRVPPTSDAPPLAVLKAVKREPNKTVDIAKVLVDAWQHYRQLRLDAEKAEDAAERMVYHALGDAEAGVFEGGRVIVKSTNRKAYEVKASVSKSLKLEEVS